MSPTAPASLLRAVYEREGVFADHRYRPKINRGPIVTPRRVGVSPFSLAADPNRSLSKRLFDVIAASIALIFFAPFFITIAMMIKATSPGPVFFRQKRYGQNNRLFRIYKFRTMDHRLGDATGVRQTTCNDPRVTRVGRFLRQTSFDELPQLINVLRGDMSLVGPRPHVPGMHAANRLYEELIPYYFHRHAVRPGITGLAQVNGCRGSTIEPNAAIERIDYDLEYIEKWSVALDIAIIVRTIRREFLFGSGS